MHVKALAILLLLSGFIAGLWKLYDAGGDARENQLVRQWQEERLELVLELDKARARTETQIQKDRIVYRDRIKTIERVSDTCTIPPDILRVHADAGIYRE